jgi:hypothetical protein
MYVKLGTNPLSASFADRITGRLEGSVFVSRRARTYLQGKYLLSLQCWHVEFFLADKLRYSKFKDEVEHMISIFDKSVKLSFRNPTIPAFIRFGTSKDRDLTVDIRSGQMKIAG